MIGFYVVYGTDTKVLWQKDFYYTGDNYPYSYYLSSTTVTETDWHVVATATGTSVLKLTLHNIRQYAALNLTELNKTITGLDTIDLSDNMITANAGTLPAVYPTKAHDLDLTNSKFSKAVYLGDKTAPIYYTVNNNVCSVNNFKFVAGYNIYLYNKTYTSSSSKFTNAFISNRYVPISLSELNGSTTISPAKKQAYNWQYETKLYASEFYQPTIVLDGTNIYHLKLENILSNEQSDLSLQVTKYASTNMDNSVCYKVDMYTGGYLQEETPIDNIVTGQLTEIPLQTSSYLEYIRNGFNYDNADYQRQANQAKHANLRNILSSVAQLGISIAPGASTGIKALAKFLPSMAVNQNKAYYENAINYTTKAYNYNLAKFKSHRSKARSTIKDVDAWNAEQRGYYGAAKASADLINRLQAQADIAQPDVNWNDVKGDIASSLSGIGSLVLSQGINTAVSAAAASATVDNLAVSQAATQAKLQYANTVTYSTSDISLSRITKGTESYYYTALPKEEIRKHIADTFN